MRRIPRNASSTRSSLPRRNSPLLRFTSAPGCGKAHSPQIARSSCRCNGELCANDVDETPLEVSMGADEAAARHRSVGDVDTATDRSLVDRAQTGDREAFAQL